MKKLTLFLTLSLLTLIGTSTLVKADTGADAAVEEAAVEEAAVEEAAVEEAAVEEAAVEETAAVEE